MNPFEEMKQIFTGGEFDLESPFMINRLLNYVPETFLLSTEVNKYASRLPKWAIKAIYKQCIPKRGNPPFIKYARKPKQEEPILIRKVCDHMCCSETSARQFLKLLRKCGHKPESFFGLKKGQ